MNERIDIPYGPFRLVAATYRGVPQAVAFLGRLEKHRVNGDSLEEALADLQLLLEKDKTTRATLRIEGIPTANEYAEAVLGLRNYLSEETKSLVRAHLKMPELTASLSDLARATKCDRDTARRLYSSFGRLLGNALEFHPKVPPASRLERGLAAFCLPIDEAAHEQRWQLRNEVAIALAAQLG